MTIQLSCEVYHLGVVPYALAWELQKKLVIERGQNHGIDRLLLLEHPHTYTLGSSSKQDHLLWDEIELRRREISLYPVDRGGDITYHGYGQLIGYPIIQLPSTLGADGHLRMDVVAYLRDLEQVIIQTLAVFAIQGERLDGYTGVWVKHDHDWAKVAAIGIKVNTKRITMHGFALNINTDLSYFQGIVPCGIQDKTVTSMAVLLGYPLDFSRVMDAIIQSFGDVFGFQMTTQPTHELLHTVRS